MAQYWGFRASWVRTSVMLSAF